MKAVRAMVAATLLACQPLAASETPCEPRRQAGAGTIAGLGALMSVPTYFLWVTLHEGSHALAAASMGAKDVRLDVLPSRLSDGTLAFGRAHWDGNLTRNQELFAILAPKATNLVALGGYAALLETGNLPRNKVANLALTMVATGALVDFSKHLFQTNPGNDMVRAYRLMGAETKRGQVPFRLLHGTLAAGAAIEVGRGWYELFKKAPGVPREKKKHLTPYGSPVITGDGVGWSGEF